VGLQDKKLTESAQEAVAPGSPTEKTVARVHRSFFPGGKIARTRKCKVCIQRKLYARVFTEEFTLIKLINNASLLWKREVNHRLHKRKKIYSILSEINPLYSIRTCSYKIHFNVIFSQPVFEQTKLRYDPILKHIALYYKLAFSQKSTDIYKRDS